MIDDAFLVVARTFQALRDALQWLTRKQIPESNQDIAMQHDGDCDFRVYVGPQARVEAVHAFLRCLRRRVQSFHDVVNTLNLIISAALLAAKGFSGMWWSIPHGLLRLHSRLHELKSDPVNFPPLPGELKEIVA